MAQEVVGRPGREGHLGYQPRLGPISTPLIGAGNCGEGWRGALELAETRDQVMAGQV